MPDSPLTGPLALDAAVDLTRTGDLWLFRGRSAADHAIRARHEQPGQPRRDGGGARRHAAADVARRARPRPARRVDRDAPPRRPAARPACRRRAVDRPLRAAGLAAAARPDRHAGDGGGAAAHDRPDGRHAVPGDGRAGRSLGPRTGAPARAGRDDVLRRGGRRDVPGDGAARRASARRTTTTPAASGPATSSSCCSVRGSATRSGSSSESPRVGRRLPPPGAGGICRSDPPSSCASAGLDPVPSSRAQV